MSSARILNRSRLASTPIPPRRHLDVQPACLRWRHDELDALAGRRFRPTILASDI